MAEAPAKATESTKRTAAKVIVWSSQVGSQLGALVAAALEELGIEAIVAFESVESSWAILDQIPTSDAIAVVVTPYEQVRAPSDIASLVGRANDRVPLIPVLVDGAEPPPSLEFFPAALLDSTWPQSAASVARVIAEAISRPAAPLPVSPTLARLARDLDRPATAAEVADWILREHQEYGGGVSQYQVDLAVEGPERTGREWLDAVGLVFDRGVVDQLHGRLAIVGLAVCVPALGQRLLESGLLPAIESEIREDVQTLLTSEGRMLREALSGTPRAGYTADTVGGADLLDVDKDVNALAAVLAARDNKPPLSVGLFGRWGTGKSFFMHRLEEQMEELGRTAPTVYCDKVVHIRFNAWHYVDANLWASLVAHIFERLADHAGEDPKAREQELLERLEVSRVALERRRREHHEAQARADRFKDDLDRTTEARFDHRKELGALQLGEATAEVIADRDVQAKAVSVAKALGVAVPDDKELIEAVEEARGLAARAKVAWRYLRERPARLLWTIPVAVGVGLIVWAVASGVAAVVAGVVGSVLAFVVEIGRALRPMRELADSAERARTKREREVNDELERLRKHAAEEGEAVEAAERELEKTQRALDELTTGRGLRRFIEERAADDRYTRHLGIIAAIQRDFDELSKLLAPPDGEATAGDSGLPEVERIVLYVDDLDRCPSRNVVEVLQAVHLLLAFPLFVVVVGVDARWLIDSLGRHHVAMLASEAETGLPRLGDRAGGGEGAGHASGRDHDEWRSRPRDYLEKIFQIPFALAPMPETGYGRLVDEMIPVRTPARPTAPGDDLPADAVDSGSSDGAGAAGNYAASGSAVERAPRPEPAAPPSLVLEVPERDLLRAVWPLIPTPRAAKRLVNVYRFIRAGIPASELGGFVGRLGYPGAFRAVVVMLAVLIGRPDDADAVFDVLADPAKGDDWSALRESLKAEPGTKAVAAELGKLDEHLLPPDYPADHFRGELLARVKRFSFDY